MAANFVPRVAHLRISLIGALKALHALMLRYPEESVEGCAEIALRSYADARGYDYEEACHLAIAHAPLVQCGDEKALICQILEWLARTPGTVISRLAKYGPELVLNALEHEQNAMQCIKLAELDDLNHEATLEFWDHLSRTSRRVEDDAKTAAGKLGERLTIEHEKRILYEAGIHREPDWVARRNTTLGFDVRSYRRDAQGTIRDHYVEAKAHGGDFSFYLTKNEWKVGSRAGIAYEIHLWDRRDQSLIVIKPEQLEMVLPIDQSGSEWQVAYVTLENGRAAAVRLSSDALQP